MGELDHLLPPKFDEVDSQISFEHQMVKRLCRYAGLSSRFLSKEEEREEFLSFSWLYGAYPSINWDLTAHRVFKYSVAALFKTPTKSEVWEAWNEQSRDNGRENRAMLFRAKMDDNTRTELVLFTGHKINIQSLDQYLYFAVRSVPYYITTLPKFAGSFIVGWLEA